ncbi:FAD-binding oxidoreductase [Cyclobacterium plantarum]|uniref:Flavodoxin reductase n=1 Tax=Cyclobacterium plantarum TaxID=2716263 RepID=A0ABX0H2A6_9BACT|nr:FAD-binding oxidoreductase [Cyclobacterium plantarum]NHE55920.1 flavodoxin reductase [Cyclobacterium plantarum]
MDTYQLQILEKKQVTHDTYSFKVEKPGGYRFQPGQATELSLLKEGWEEEKRPFTFTSLPSDDFLEFTIKTYDEHEGVTKRLGDALPGDKVEIGDAWGAIEYKGEGVFIAGGAGITPFIAIFRDLRQKNKIGNNELIFANKTNDDIILFEELKTILGHKFHNIIEKQADTAYDRGRIDKAYLKGKINDFKNQHFYICGPEGFMKAVDKALKDLGANPEALVFEQ